VVADEKPGRLVEFHRWRGVRRVDRGPDGQAWLWPTYVYGWVSVEMIPVEFMKRLRAVIDEVRRRG
jgi:hypothetical protein